eukprot:m.172984 g.172984  ORF g.172984 m.172984 type:complete len:731 (+) comp24302_c0_seq1:3784-5976(+)
METKSPRKPVDMAAVEAGGSYWSPYARVALTPIFSIKGHQKKVPEDHPVDVIAQAIAEQAPTLRTVELSGNTFDLDACKEIAKALQRCKNLELFLCDDAFTSRLKTMIHPALGLLAEGLIGSRLTVLDLSDNAVNPQGAERLSPFLIQCFTLKELYLNNTGVGPSGGKILGDTLVKACENAAAARVPYGLTRFVLGRSRLETEGAEALAAAFTMMKTLVEIRVFQNGIPPPAAEKLAASFAVNTDLEVIDVSDNRLKLQGSVALATSIVNCRKLRRLNLSDNLIRHRGGMEVARALQSELPALEAVDLSGNDLSPEVGRLLGRALSKKAGLVEIKIQDNAFGEDLADEIGADLAAKGRFVDVSGSFELEEDDREEQDADSDDTAFVALHGGGVEKQINAPTIDASPKTTGQGLWQPKSSPGGFRASAAKSTVGEKPSFGGASPAKPAFGGTPTAKPTFGGTPANTKLAFGGTPTAKSPFGSTKATPTNDKSIGVPGSQPSAASSTVNPSAFGSSAFAKMSGATGTSASTKKASIWGKSSATDSEGTSKTESKVQPQVAPTVTATKATKPIFGNVAKSGPPPSVGTHSTKQGCPATADSVDFADFINVAAVCRGLVQLASCYDGSAAHDGLLKRLWCGATHVLNSYMVALALIHSEDPQQTFSEPQLVALWNLLKLAGKKGFLSSKQRAVIAVVASDDAMHDRGLDTIGMYAGSRNLDALRTEVTREIAGQ